MMNSYVWLQTSDGSIEQVEQDVALFSPFLHHEIQAGMGCSKMQPIALPSIVTPTILGLILDYCRFHHLSGRSNLERKIFNEKFIRMEPETLRDLTSAAYSLQIRPLADLGCDALARLIKRKSVEEIRQAFGLPNDTTEEENWDPIKLDKNDPQVRLLNKLYAKKMKEKEKRQMVDGLQIQNVQHEAPHADDRSIDELLSFINGENGDSKEAKPSKNKKKHRKGRNKQKDAPSVCTFSDGQNNANVEDFAWRLNLDWPERMQELWSITKGSQDSGYGCVAKLHDRCGQ